MTMRKISLVALAAVGLTAGVALAFPSEVVEEIFADTGYMPTILPTNPADFDARPGPALGEVVDGYWRVQPIAPGTWAIGEPQDAPDNYEYLLVGQTRALLIDAGSTVRDIHPALAKLTNLPITVVPTHLHYDHTNGIGNFRSIALIDLPETRARVRDGVFRASRHEYAGPKPPAFRVTEWVKPDGIIDLGGRQVRLLSTPGHTPSSVSIHDPAAKLLFTGDYIYTTTLYAQEAGASLSAYQATADRLLAALPADTRIYGAHCCRNDVPIQAPWLAMSDLRDVRLAVADIRAGKAKGRGFILHRFPVNSKMTLLTFYPFGDR